MLVLGRKRLEKIIIGPSLGPVVIQVMEIRGECVRLGFTASDGTRIHRDEVWQRIKAETPEQLPWELPVPAPKVPEVP